MFKVSNKDSRTTPVLVFLLLTLNIFHTFFCRFYCWLWMLARYLFQSFPVFCSKCWRKTLIYMGTLTRNGLIYRCTSLLEKFPYSGFFWSAFSRIRTENEEILRISLHSIRLRENTDQNNSEHGDFSCSAFVVVLVNARIQTHYRKIMNKKALSLDKF